MKSADRRGERVHSRGARAGDAYAQGFDGRNRMQQKGNGMLRFSLSLRTLRCSSLDSPMYWRRSIKKAASCDGRSSSVHLADWSGGEEAYYETLVSDHGYAVVSVRAKVTVREEGDDCHGERGTEEVILRRRDSVLTQSRHTPTYSRRRQA